METFEELQHLWSKQPQIRNDISATYLMQRAVSKIRRLRAWQFSTIVIITVLVAFLIYYFLYMRKYAGVNAFTLGLSLMIATMVVRILLEIISSWKVGRIHSDFSMDKFTNMMIDYYNWRKKIHFVFTPIVYSVYVVGFTLLLPTLKGTMSSGMFVYTLVSGYLFLGVFALFVRKKFRQEREVLEYLNQLID